ncbi:MAG: S-layer homology domain-containing protein [Oscillospiraceae bacterium]|nr:S-layer homology domain-containing protein [Oscillospiraceae bacterium]
MKRPIRILLIVVVFACALGVRAFASEYDSAAGELKTLGLFQGTNDGFELDRAPTRTEAAVMLVRLLGSESQAKAQYAEGAASCPFTDMPDWAKPYVSWLYENDLVKGVSDTVFGASGQCTAKMYCTFVLRALGYSDSEGDFTFDQAVDLAEYIGVCDADMAEGTFLRDYAVAISYRALAASLNGTETSLLEKLVAEGAVQGESADVLLDKVKNYRAYRDAYEKSSGLYAASTVTTGSARLSNTKTAASYTMSEQSSYKYIISDYDFQMEYIGNYSEGNETYTACAWIKDGYYYRSDDSSKSKQPLTDSLMDSMFSGDTPVRMPALYDVKSVEVSKTLSGAQYILTYADDYDYLSYSNDYWNLGLDRSAIMNLLVGKCTLTAVVGGNGLISSFKSDFSCAFLYDSGDRILPLILTDTSEDVVNATGSGVYISFPDFSGFTELS